MSFYYACDEFDVVARHVMQMSMNLMLEIKMHLLKFTSDRVEKVNCNWVFYI